MIFDGRALYAPFMLSIAFVILCLSARETTAGPYLNSAHGNSTTGVTRPAAAAAGYGRGNCGHCHEQHASIGGTEPVPVDGGPSGNLLFTVNAGNTFCYYCHDLSQQGGADDIQTQINKTSSHNPATNPDSPTCIECHDPHLAQQSTAGTARGNDATTGAVKGVAGVEATWSTPSLPGPGSETLLAPTYTPVDPITKEYQLCLKCHSSYPVGGPPTGLTDQGKEFNPFNFSAHPVAASSWKNTFLKNNAATAMHPPWNTATPASQPSMYCSDCHGSETSTDPKGPHGSNNVYMLKKVGPAAFSWAQGPYDSLCLDCHDIAAGSNFGDHPDGRSAHAAILGCFACHGANVGVFGGRTGNIHGTNYRFPNGTTKQGAEVLDSGLRAERFLVGGYITELYNTSVLGGVVQADGSNSCGASDADAGINDGECSMGAKSF